MRLLALPYAPLPRRLVYLDAQRDAHHYRVRLRWDGSLAVLPARAPGRRRFVLVLDPHLPYRRRFRLPPARRIDRRLFLGLVEELFPFRDDGAAYALGEWSGESHVYALERPRLTALIAGLARPPSAVLVADGEPQALARALVRWSRSDSLSDLLGGPRPLPAAAPLAAVLGLGFAGLLGWAVTDLATMHAVRAASAQALAQQLEHDASRLARQRDALVHIGSVAVSLQSLAQAGNAWPRERLHALLMAMPRGAMLRSIELQGDEIRIVGWDANRLQWLASFPHEVEVLEHQPLAERDYFRLALKHTAAP